MAARLRVGATLFCFGLLSSKSLAPNTTTYPTSVKRCKDGSQIPAVAYYLNRETDTERRTFIETKLATAGLHAVRITGQDGGSARERVLSGQRTPRLVHLARMQTHCLQTAKKTSSRMGCFSKMMRSGNCSHVSAYGPSAGRTSGARQCNGYLANYIGKMRAISRIVLDAKHNRVHGHVMLLEDDTSPTPNWEVKYCKFLGKQPSSGWDVAKIDSVRTRNVQQAYTLAEKHATQAGKTLPKAKPSAYIYTARHMARLRLDHASKFNPMRVPFGWGAATLVFHTKYAARLYGLFDNSQIDSVDVHLLRNHLHQKYRLAMSEHLIFDSGDNEHQGYSSIEGILSEVHVQSSRELVPAPLVAH